MNDVIKIMSIDPGVTTGYTYGYLEEKLAYKPFQSMDTVEDLWKRLQEFDPRYIIMEDFEFRGGARAGLNLFPVQLIGVASLYEAVTKSQTALVLQKASTGKSFYTDAQLKSLGLYKRGIPHGMDASRHLLQWMTFGAGYQYLGDKQPKDFFRALV